MAREQKKLFTFSSNDTEKSGSMLAGGRPEPSPANQQSQFLGTSMLGVVVSQGRAMYDVTSIEGIRRRAQSDLNGRDGYGVCSLDSIISLSQSSLIGRHFL